ncbi:hypothetical protein CPB83DRAFT_848059 [Crepidotus variabilis]|uniref:Uncharacterized protein n=1 Tax=Crepidotus variabilis TaxID=179855 RepID=A0A9P6ENQ1_9AGAR|nr:hypothetical protein CPB83DRAFT_848059 [Crepidotus variabilis]
MGSLTSKSIKAPEEFPTQLHAYYALSRALLDGAPHRPALPLEIIIQVFDVAGIARPGPTKDLAISDDSHFLVNANDAETQHTTILQSEPITSDWLNQVVQFQVSTTSRDQGWVGDPNAGNWSWIEVWILTAGPISATTPGQTATPQEKMHPERLLRWISHHNTLAERQYATHQGILFEPDHEIWCYLEKGDIIAVKACCRFGGWQNEVKHCSLKFWKKFNPTSLALY